MNILIVEDDPMVGQINQRFASKIPFVKDITIAAKLDEAKKLLEVKKFDLLLLDVYFPEGHGPDLLQWIREKNIPLNVIFITADNSRKTIERAMHLGAMDYLVKPFTFERFKAAIEDANSRIIDLQNKDDFSQDMLDHVFQKKSGKEEGFSSELDKGMSYKTYEMVKSKVLKINGSFTAEQMGDQLGMARVTTRRYLDYMEKKNLLDVELEYGKIGRPQHHYRVKK